MRYFIKEVTNTHMHKALSSRVLRIGSTACVLYADGNKICVHNVYSDEQITLSNPHRGPIVALATSDSQLDPYFATAGEDYSVCLWSTQKFYAQRTIKPHRTDVSALALHNLPKPFLCIGYEDGTIIVWDLLLDKAHYHGNDHADFINDIAFSCSINKATTSELLMFTASDDGTCKAFSLQPAKYLKNFQHPKRVVSVAVANKDIAPVVATGASDFAIRLWDFESATLLRLMEGHFDSITSLGFWQSHEILLISASEDTSIRVWDALSGEGIVTFVGHTDAVQSISVVSNPQPAVIGCSQDCTAVIWNLDLVISDYFRSFFFCVTYDVGMRNSRAVFNPPINYVKVKKEKKEKRHRKSDKNSQIDGTNATSSQERKPQTKEEASPQKKNQVNNESDIDKNTSSKPGLKSNHDNRLEKSSQKPAGDDNASGSKKTQPGKIPAKASSPRNNFQRVRLESYDERDELESNRSRSDSGMDAFDGFEKTGEADDPPHRARLGSDEDASRRSRSDSDHDKGLQYQPSSMLSESNDSKDTVGIRKTVTDEVHRKAAVEEQHWHRSRTDSQNSEDELENDVVNKSKFVPNRSRTESYDSEEVSQRRRLDSSMSRDNMSQDVSDRVETSISKRRRNSTRRRKLNERRRSRMNEAIDDEEDLLNADSVSNHSHSTLGNNGPPKHQQQRKMSTIRRLSNALMSWVTGDPPDKANDLHSSPNGNSKISPVFIPEPSDQSHTIQKKFIQAEEGRKFDENMRKQRSTQILMNRLTKRKSDDFDNKQTDTAHSQAIVSQKSEENQMIQDMLKEHHSQDARRKASVLHNQRKSKNLLQQRLQLIGRKTEMQSSSFQSIDDDQKSNAEPSEIGRSDSVENSLNVISSTDLMTQRSQDALNQISADHASQTSSNDKLKTQHSIEILQKKMASRSTIHQNPPHEEVIHTENLLYNNANSNQPISNTSSYELPVSGLNPRSLSTLETESSSKSEGFGRGPIKLQPIVEHQSKSRGLSEDGEVSVNKTAMRAKQQHKQEIDYDISSDSEDGI